MRLLNSLAFLFLVGLVLAVVLGILFIVCSWGIGLLMPVTRERCTMWRRRLLSHRRVMGITILFSLLFVGIFYVSSVVPEWQEVRQLRHAMADASRLIVRTGGNCHRNPELERTFFQTDRLDAIADLANRFSFAYTPFASQCMCCGDMTFDFYRGDTLICSFSFHHGSHIRIKGGHWGDINLTAGSRLRVAQWLENNGYSEAKKAFEAEQQKMVDQAMEEYKKSKSAASPKPLIE